MPAASGDEGGFTLSGGEPLMQDRFRRAAVRGGQGHGRAHRDRDQRLLRRSPVRRRAADIDLVILDMKAFTRGAA